MLGTGGLNWYYVFWLCTFDFPSFPFFSSQDDQNNLKRDDQSEPRPRARQGLGRPGPARGSPGPYSRERRSSPRFTHREARRHTDNSHRPADRTQLMAQDTPPSERNAFAGRGARLQQGAGAKASLIPHLRAPFRQRSGDRSRPGGNAPTPAGHTLG